MQGIQTSSWSTRFVHFVNTYSIWVLSGSFITFIFFAKLFNGSIDWIIATGFALGIWFIYTLDHLLDGIKLGDSALSLRHKKHFTQKRKILVLLYLVAFIGVLLSFHVDAVYYNSILLLAILTGIHFIINHLVRNEIKEQFFLKEVFIAFVVTVGFVVVPSVNSNPDTMSIWLLFVPLLFVNLSNLLLFTLFDKEVDQATSTLSAASFYTNQELKWVVRILLVLAIISIVLAYTFGTINTVSMLLLVSMVISLLLLDRFDEYFAYKDRYRFFGDMIYLYPAIALPFL